MVSSGCRSVRPLKSVRRIEAAPYAARIKLGWVQGREAAQTDDRQPFPRLNKGKRGRVSPAKSRAHLGTAGSAINATAKALLEHEPLFLASVARRVEGWLRAAIGTK